MLDGSNQKQTLYHFILGHYFAGHSLWGAMPRLKYSRWQLAGMNKMFTYCTARLLSLLTVTIPPHQLLKQIIFVVLVFGMILCV